MSHVTLMRNGEPAPRTARRSLFKRDHTRAIDYYIDYFGRTTGAFTIVDPCGEALLDSFDSEEPLTAASIVEVRS